MLELRNIVKTYQSGDTTVSALNGVSLCFRENEFVSILGASGCGKTTMLNILGGLDRYTSGDLIINGKSTKLFRDSDWDTYRNHSVGFVFQSYNLIPHQTVLSNVELALTLSGISKHERRTRAIEALNKVGLGDQLNKKPNQMSGGQMQRVAIARALVNNPDILLADEPTGALDTQTSVQIMELLKEVASDRLVVMVTHNPELAQAYSTRIVKLSDGRVVDDSNPLTEEEYATLSQRDTQRRIQIQKDKKASKAERKKTSMSFATAISLSMKNLMTKKGRTVLTSFAGSIGIIGIALILSLSNGIQLFINQVQEDTLSTYPLSIQKEQQNLSAMMEAMTSVSEDDQTEKDPNKIYVDNSLDRMAEALGSTTSNDLESFKQYLDGNYDKIKDYVSDVQYTYDFDLEAYTADGVTKLGIENMLENMGDNFSSLSNLVASSGTGMFDVMSEMINNQELLDQQYELVKGEWPQSPTDIVLVVSSDNKISKMTLYMLGILDQSELEDIMETLMTEGKVTSPDVEPFELDYFLNMKFRLLTTQDFFEKTDKYYGENNEYPVWKDLRNDPGFDQEAFVTQHGKELRISGIIRPKAGAAASSISGALGYTKGLTDMILEDNRNSEVINQQKATPDYNVLTGIKYERTKYTPETIIDLINKIDPATMSQFYSVMTEQIKTNPEFSNQIKVDSPETFMGMFMMLPAEDQADFFKDILTKANENNPEMTNMLISLVASDLGIEGLNASNIMTVFPVLNTKSHVLMMLNGVTKAAVPTLPVDIPGLMTLAGEDFMSGDNGMFSKLEKKILTMEVDEQLFLTLLSTLEADSKEFTLIEDTLYKMAPQTDATYNSTLKKLGDAEEASPASINFYAKDFESKDKIEEFIAEYNAGVNTPQKIEYTDIIGVMMSSVTIIINVISYVLIAFVAISLVVSSIMIGIITNISVLERTKEIGILRAIGASKKDISRVFNAETFIIGLAAGIIGIVFTLVLCLPTNAIIQALSGFKNIRAALPFAAAIILVLISMGLTILAGLIPAKKASRKDPVVALRTE